MVERPNILVCSTLNVCLTVFSNLTLLFNKGGKRILIFHGTCTNNTYNESRLNEENQSFPELIFGDKSVLESGNPRAEHDWFLVSPGTVHICA
jgi:hypothetical protein